LEIVGFGRWYADSAEQADLTNHIFFYSLVLSLSQPHRSFRLAGVMYSKKPKVLLVCTLNPQKLNLQTEELTLNPQQPSLFPETFTTIQNIKYDGILDVLLMREDRAREPGYKNNLKKMNKARDIFLKGDYDLFFTIEADMIVPEDCLERLVLTLNHADVAYGFYCSRHTSKRWLVFDETGSDMNPVLQKKVLDNWGKIIPSWGMGFGCTLIKRKVLEEITFRIVERGAAADAYFAQDARVAGFVQKHDLGVVCGHIVQPYPMQVVYPHNQAPFYKVWQRKRRFEMAEPQTGMYTALKALTLPDRTVRKGEKVTLTSQQAAALLLKQAIEPAEGEYPEVYESPPVIRQEEQKEVLEPNLPSEEE
jgi:hypothetical protein